MNVQLADAFTAAVASVEQTGKLIFGAPGNGGSWEDLPEQVGDYRDAMARYVAEGRFAKVDMTNSLTDIIHEWTRRQVSCPVPVQDLSRA